MNPSDPPTDFTGLAVAIGGLQVRVEEGFKGVRESIDKLAEASSAHGNMLNEHEVKIQLLQERLPKRTPWYQTWGIVIAAVAVVATIGGVIIALIQVANALQ